MPRLIDADALLEQAGNSDKVLIIGGRFGGGKTVAMAKELLKQKVQNAPTIEAEPVKHGEWVPVEPGSDVWFRCSECEVEISTSWNYDLDAGWNFCPCCGAKMDGERREKDD